MACLLALDSTVPRVCSVLLPSILHGIYVVFPFNISGWHCLSWTDAVDNTTDRMISYK